MKNFLGKKILWVTAHPDDESYLAAGTIARNKKAGGDNCVVCATKGGRGKSHLAKAVPAAMLKSMRQTELVKCCQYLKVSSLFCWDMPDGGLVKKKLLLFGRVLKIAFKMKPEIVVSFGKDGVSGHLDHVTIGLVAKRVAKLLSVPFVAFAAPPSYIAHVTQKTGWLKTRRVMGRYKRRLQHVPFSVKVKIDPKVKFKALSFHKSQFKDGVPFSGFPPEVKKDWLKGEYFVV